MGFEVTATHVIFFVALLTAGSAAMGAYWGNTTQLEESRRDQSERAIDRAHTNLTISGVQHNNGQERLEFTVTNGGQTVLDIDDFVFLIDGAYNASLESATIAAAPSSDLLVPGDSMSVVFDPITSPPTSIVVVAPNGFKAHWRS